MAEINVGVRPTNDPQYTNFSQGTDRAQMQPLADVPNLSTKYVQPDWPTNKAAGQAIKDIGDISESALKLTDAVIQKKSDDMLTDSVNRIRDSFGVGDAVNNAGEAAAIGKAGAEGVSLSDSDNTPMAVQRLQRTAGGLLEKYNQGELSNAAYWARMDKEVRIIKAQFPGYSDIIDQQVTAKLGAQPANMLRGALLTDAGQLAAKLQALNDKQNHYNQENAKYIYSAPELSDFDSRRASGNPYPQAYVESVVGKMKADEYQRESDGQKLAISSKVRAAQQDDAEKQGLQFASKVASDLVLTTQNKWGIKSPTDMMNFIANVQSGKIAPLTADEKQQVTAIAAQLRQVAVLSVDNFMNKPLTSNSQETRLSKLGDKSRMDNIRQAALGPITDMEDALNNKEHGLLAVQLQHNQAVREAAQGDVLSVPQYATLGAMKDVVGDQIAGQVALQDANVQAVVKGTSILGINSVNQGEPLQKTLDLVKQHVIKDKGGTPTDVGTAIKMHIDNQTNFIENPKSLKDPKFADKAFQSLYGSGNEYFMSQLTPNSAVGAFSDLYSERAIRAVEKRTSEDKQTFVNSAKSNFASIFEDQVRRANNAAENIRDISGAKVTPGPFDYSGTQPPSGVRVAYNPKTMQFSFTGDPSITKTANASLSGLNTGLRPMKRVFEMSGDNPTTQIYSLLRASGIEPGSAIYGAVQKAYEAENPPEESNP